MQNGQVAYQIKGNEVYNKMLAIILPIHKHLTPEMGTKGQIFLNVVILYIKLKKMKHTTKCMHNFWPYTHPDFWGLD